MNISQDFNFTRFRPGDPAGHYESFFQRANHPTRPLAFWIRYTVFSPQAQPQAAVGELWAIYFDGESGQHTAVKQAHAIRECSFSHQTLDVHIATSTLREGSLEGQAASSGSEIRWSLRYTGGQPPLFLLPEAYYERGFPKAKALVGVPNAVYEGQLSVDGRKILIEGWTGSQNHNWGSRHTDLYAWGQVAGFAGAPEAFLELSTARLRLGPLWTPWMTLIVLRLEGKEYALNAMSQALHARGKFTYGRPEQPFTWQFDSQTPAAHIQGRISAPAQVFVGLRYDNPPGGQKICLNTKLADCELTLEAPGVGPRRLTAYQRAAFEILTDHPTQSVRVVA